jgi:hypothetical protein
MARDFIPDTDKDFYEWEESLCTYISGTLPAWNIPQTAYAEVDTLRSAFVIAYHAAVGPDPKKSETHEKNRTRDAFKKKLREFLKAYVTYNPAVTDDERDQAGLPIHKPSGGHHPIPVSHPIAIVDTSIIRQVTLRLLDSITKSRAKPFGVHGAEALWAKLDHPPTSIDELTNSAFTTTSSLTLKFGEEDRGKTVYYCLRWENTRGEKGPWGPIESVKIP